MVTKLEFYKFLIEKKHDDLPESHARTKPRNRAVSQWNVYQEYLLVGFRTGGLIFTLEY